MKTLLFTPPFTQLNTPYPATAYIKGFLATLGIDAVQADLGIEVILKVFSRDGFERMFSNLSPDQEASENALRIIGLGDYYIQTIDPVISFLQDKNPTLAHTICAGEYLPEASRFEQLDDMEWAFGSMGIRDKARHLATLYLEDISDLISELIDPHFGFSRYAERLSRTATSFDGLYNVLQQKPSFIDEILISILRDKFDTHNPQVVGISIPFPGNLYAGLRAAQWIKQQHPDVKIIMGGGYPNTELRSISDDRFFEFIDFLTLDDGEAPIAHIYEYLDGKRELTNLKRTFTLRGGVVTFINGSKDLDVAQRDVGTPDYSDFQLDQYLSVIEIANPMHRLWSDGRWNKLTLAHGCYWGKCSFCDVTLDYIKRYEPVNATLICDRIETIILQTGQHGFHFVDEAAPPALMRDVAMEIINRGLTVTWWTNIRFEHNFTADLCKLLATSGCIAVSGGLEVASDRLLALMKKGVTVSQVAKVAQNFTNTGIMVHAYLMYGFPTQTSQETIDSLEMVRQLFSTGVLQSGFWHQFAMTAHSPVGLDPSAYHVSEIGPGLGTFANNDLYHNDPNGADHERYSTGLKKSLFNYMHNIGLDFQLQEWFEFKVPKPSIKSNYIKKALTEHPSEIYKNNQKVIWLGSLPTVYLNSEDIDKDLVDLNFYNKKDSWNVAFPKDEGRWIMDTLVKMVMDFKNPYTIGQLRDDLESYDLDGFEQFRQSETWGFLRDNGMVVI